MLTLSIPATTQEALTICIAIVEFEQDEYDGKNAKYCMSSFFKAWTAYCGILVKLAPSGLQGDLATALFVYTITLYNLLERYTWEGVKVYHFQFHRNLVASGRSLYLPSEWQQLDRELLASKFFGKPNYTMHLVARRDTNEYSLPPAIQTTIPQPSHFPADLILPQQSDGLSSQAATNPPQAVRFPLLLVKGPPKHAATGI